MPPVIHRHWGAVVWIASTIFTCGIVYSKFHIEAQNNGEKLREMRVLVEEMRANIILIRVEAASMRTRLEVLADEARNKRLSEPR